MRIERRSERWQKGESRGKDGEEVKGKERAVRIITLTSSLKLR